MKTTYFILFSSILLFECSNSYTSPLTHLDTTSIIRDFYFEETQKDDFSKYRRVVIINENGTCLNCNNAFAQAHAKNIADDSTLFIVSSEGAMVDISPYISRQRPNVIWDTFYAFESLLTMNQCAILELNPEVDLTSR